MSASRVTRKDEAPRIFIPGKSLPRCASTRSSRSRNSAAFGVLPGSGTIGAAKGEP